MCVSLLQKNAKIACFFSLGRDKKYPDQSKLTKKMFILSHSSRVPSLTVGKSEVAGYRASTLREQRKMNGGVSSLAPCSYSSETLWGPPAAAGSVHFINRVKIVIHRHTQLPVSRIVLEITKTTTESVT